MESHEFFGGLAAFVAAMSMAIYVLAILRGETKPNRASYWVWFALATVIFLTYRESGGTTVWLLGMYALNPLVAAVLSIWYGEGTGLGKLDRMCLAVVGLNAPVWIGLRAWFGDGAEAAIPLFVANMIMDVAATIPVFEKTWNRPETEDGPAWVLCAVATTLNLFAVTEWTFVDVVWNAWMWSAGAFIAASACLRPRSRSVSGG